VLYTKCKFRDQQAPFPFWEMMGEVGKFEMGRKLLSYEEGQSSLITYEKFVQMIERLNDDYDLREGHYSGIIGEGGLLKDLNL
jgi:hypothetical protein